MTQYEMLDRFFKLRRAINIHAIKRLKGSGLSPKQAALLRCIATQGTVSLSELAGMTLSDPAAITRAVDSLVKRGLLEKKDSLTDRRALQLRLSPSGRHIVSRMKGIQESIARDIFSVFSLDDRKHFMSLLDKVLSEFRSNYGKEGAR